MNRRPRVLLSAFSCRPDRGSEPGLGWHLARALARHNDVWVLTTSLFRDEIEAAMARDPVPHLTFVYHGLPRARARIWNGGKARVSVGYYLWQIGAGRRARRLHRRVGFDLVHHVTFAKYWAPAAWLPGVPFLWGPVGGGESAPRSFYRAFGSSAHRFERFRDAARWVEERDPLVRRTARDADLVLATTVATAARLRRLTDAPVEVQVAVALSAEDVRDLAGRPPPATLARRFLCLGQLLHLKGFTLAVRAFARADLPEDAELWLVGDGPRRKWLERLAGELAIAHRVHFTGAVPRRQALDFLAGADALVHPALHDSGSWACVEALATGRPVVCLDLGGPAEIVTPGCGLVVPAPDPERAVEGMARAIRRLAREPGLGRRLGEEGRRRVAEGFTFERRAEEMERRYRRLLAGRHNGTET